MRLLPRPPWRLVLDGGCGIGLLLLAGLKLLQPSSLADPLVAGAAGIELLLGGALLAGRAPRLSAIGLILLGAAFCAWVWLRGVEVVDGAQCGCFGPYRLAYGSHLIIASSVLVAGGVQALVASSLTAGRPVSSAR